MRALKLRLSSRPQVGPESGGDKFYAKLIVHLHDLERISSLHERHIDWLRSLAPGASFRLPSLFSEIFDIQASSLVGGGGGGGGGGSGSGSSLSGDSDSLGAARELATNSSESSSTSSSSSSSSLSTSSRVSLEERDHELDEAPACQPEQVVGAQAEPEAATGEGQLALEWRSRGGGGGQGDELFFVGLEAVDQEEREARLEELTPTVRLDCFEELSSL